jgi:hypothetical protein
MTDEAKRRHHYSQGTKILNNVSRPTQHRFVPDDTQNWNRSFGRNSLDVPPQVLVQHQVAYDGDPALIKSREIAQDVLHV